MKRNFNNGISGFTLIEVMIAVAIVSIGLVMILQGFVSSLNAVKISEGTLTACMIADSRMAYAQLESENNPEFMRAESSEAFVSENLEFSWEFIPEIIDMPETGDINEELFSVTSVLNWKDGKRKGDIKIETLFRQKKEAAGF
ncbi:prepilin-type N-terminal cleavage/methylation domain-containing protein [bacterium]|nr:prepilin-type N-terminal cleavage/methylation domain-containing protein [bacterium]